MEIKKEFGKNGYKYKLLMSEDISKAEQKTKRIKALYLQYKNKDIFGYEVHICRYRKTNLIEGYVNPSNEEFGKFGFSFVNQDEAIKKYEGIN